MQSPDFNASGRLDWSIVSIGILHWYVVDLVPIAKLVGLNEFVAPLILPPAQWVPGGRDPLGPVSLMRGSAQASVEDQVQVACAIRDHAGHSPPHRPATTFDRCLLLLALPSGDLAAIGESVGRQ